MKNKDLNTQEAIKALSSKQLTDNLKGYQNLSENRVDTILQKEINRVVKKVEEESAMGKFRIKVDLKLDPYNIVHKQVLDKIQELVSETSNIFFKNIKDESTKDIISYYLLVEVVPPNTL